MKEIWKRKTNLLRCNVLLSSIPCKSTTPSGSSETRWKRKSKWIRWWLQFLRLRTVLLAKIVLCSRQEKIRFFFFNKRRTNCGRDHNLCVRQTLLLRFGSIWMWAPQCEAEPWYPTADSCVVRGWWWWWWSKH